MDGLTKDRSVVSGEDVRAAMRRVPMAVTVVVVGGDTPRGITIGSFVTVSLDPPLVSFNVQRSARIHAEMETAPRFAVHILSSAQEGLSEIFADPDQSGVGQFAKVDHHLDSHGIPVIPDVIARFACSVEAVYPAGDHSIILGRALELDSNESGEALLYLNRSYRSLEG
ncbi:MAG: 3-hydroxy-9,10-secoandrosta-1,3,5(10)-triene-9,17-dione monooxygenase reductase component [Rhodothermales bacterium]|jgi:3-hydroxy-9,10-secoandrosta-1,3,5(10)-triene-9,17-dione monooxygenase reductase component